jgi:hypothetical protein
LEPAWVSAWALGSGSERESESGSALAKAWELERVKESESGSESAKAWELARETGSALGSASAWA